MILDRYAFLSFCAILLLSGSGHHVIIAKMPANLAVLGAKAGIKILEEFPDERWIIGLRYTIQPAYRDYSNIYAYFDLPLRIRWQRQLNYK